jgi:hypothetical protein
MSEQDEKIKKVKKKNAGKFNKIKISWIAANLNKDWTEGDNKY